MEGPLEEDLGVGEEEGGEVGTSKAALSTVRAITAWPRSHEIGSQAGGHAANRARRSECSEVARSELFVPSSLSTGPGIRFRSSG